MQAAETLSSAELPASPATVTSVRLPGLSVPTPPPQPQTSIDLTRLLNIWAKIWASQKESSVAWVEYTEPAIERRLQRRRWHRESRLHDKHFGLTLINPTEDDVIIDMPVDGESRTTVSETRDENPQHKARKISVDLMQIWSEQRTVSDNYITTVTIGGELGGTVANMVTLKATASRAFATSRSTQAATGNTVQANIGREFEIEPGTILEIKITSQDKVVTSRVRCKVYVTGTVVICCNNKVSHDKELAGRALPNHYKWVIPIHDVFTDLQNYMAIDDARILSAADKAIIMAALGGDNPSFTICEHKENKVYFCFEGRASHTNYIRGSGVPTVYPLPGYVPPAGAPMPVGAVSAAEASSVIGREFTFDCAEATAAGAVAAKIHNPAEHTGDGLAARVALVNVAKAGDSMTFGTARATHEGALALHAPSAEAAAHVVSEVPMFRAAAAIAEASIMPIGTAADAESVK